jgi:hypothetical protein
MKCDLTSHASKNLPGAEEAPALEPVRDSDAGSNLSDQSIGMARERSDFLTRLPPVQPFPLGSKDSPKADEAPTREPARDPDIGHNSSDNSIGLARAPLPAARSSIYASTPSSSLNDQSASDRPSIGRRIFRSVASFFIMALIAVLTSIAVSSALQSHGDETKEMVRTWASSLDGSSSAWQSRGNEAKRMVKEAWASSLDWLMKKLPPDVDIAAKQKGSSPASQVSTRDAAHSTSVAEKPAPVAATVSFESVQQLKSMAQDLIAMRQRLQQLTAAQQQMAQKIASLGALKQDFKQKESSPPSSPAVPVSLRKNERTVAAAPRSILRDWWISDARNGYVYVQGHGEVYRVVPGTPLPGLGTVEQIKRQNGRWVVMTPKGIIASRRDPESDDSDMFDGD